MPVASTRPTHAKWSKIVQENQSGAATICQRAPVLRSALGHVQKGPVMDIANLDPAFGDPVCNRALFSARTSDQQLRVVIEISRHQIVANLFADAVLKGIGPDFLEARLPRRRIVPHHGLFFGVGGAAPCSEQGNRERLCACVHVKSCYYLHCLIGPF